jgi:hypothetical protein
VSEPDAFQDEMRRLLLGELGSDPLAIDQDTGDRLLSGRLDPADAPPGFAEVARVLEAAAAPTNPHELEGEATALAAFAAWRLPPASAVSHAARRRSRLGSKLAVVAVAVGVLMVGGVAAAATGSLPEPAQRVVDSVSRTAHHPPWAPPLRGDRGRARNGGQDQRPAGGGVHQDDQRGQGQGRQAVGAATGQGATGQARRGACASPAPSLAGAPGGKNRSASNAATPAGGVGKVDDSCRPGASPTRHGDDSESGLRHPATGNESGGNGSVGKGPQGNARAEGHRQESGD